MGNKLYIGNLPYSATEQALTDTFSECGAVSSVKIITDRETGRSKGFGFVEMSNDTEAQAVIEKFNGGDYDGRKMNISVAKPMEKRDSRGGGGGFNRNNRGPRQGW
jgi:RNA recognition motif-containing protein